MTYSEHTRRVKRELRRNPALKRALQRSGLPTLTDVPLDIQRAMISYLSVCKGYGWMTDPEAEETLLTPFMRVCSVCKRELELTRDFRRNRSRRTRHEYVCLSCIAERRKAARLHKKRASRMSDEAFRLLYRSRWLTRRIAAHVRRYARVRVDLREDYTQQAWERIAFSAPGLGDARYSEIARRAIEAANRRELRSRS